MTRSRPLPQPNPSIGSAIARLLALGRPSLPFSSLSARVMAQRPLTFVCPADLRIVCSSGTAWITTDGEFEDVVLTAGQTHCAKRRSRLLITGMPMCEVQLDRR